MRHLLVFLFVVSLLQGVQTSQKLFECNEIFKQRKGELLVELERIDEEKQALSALKIATEELLKKKDAKVNQRTQDVDRKFAIIAQKEESIKNMLQKNEKILAEIKSVKMSKLSETIAKMKPGSAATILSEMSSGEAAQIIATLQPKSVAQILAKMDAKKASELTTQLSK